MKKSKATPYYGIKNDVEMMREPGEENALASDSISPVAHPYQSLIIYVLTHVELATLPLLPFIALQQKRQALRQQDMLREDSQTENLNLPTVLGKSALPASLVSLLEGASWLTEKLFPAAFWGLMLHDLITFHRMHLPLAAIATDLSLRRLRQVVLWGDALTYQARHLALERLVMLTEAPHAWIKRFRALTMLEEIASSFKPREDRESFHTIALRTLNQYADNPQSSLLQKYAQYLRLCHGTVRSKNALFALAPFLLFTLSVLTAKVRIAQMLWRKAHELAAYLAAKKACEADAKVYSLTQSGNLECTVCGDWPFVYYGDIQSSQGCLEGLFASLQNASVIVAQLNSLMPYLTKQADFHVLDFSKQAIASDWPEALWNQCLTLLEAIPNLQLSAVNLSTAMANPVDFPKPMLQRLAFFLEKVSVASLDLTGQRFAVHNLKALLPGLANNSALTDLRFSNTWLNDDSACELAAILASTRITTLMLGYNHLTDRGLQYYTLRT